MANHNPNVNNLVKGRGKKPRLGRKTYTVKLTSIEKNVIDAIALSYGCQHGDGASLSAFLARIAKEELLVVPAPPSYEHVIDMPNPEDVLNQHAGSLVED